MTSSSPPTAGTARPLCDKCHRQRLVTSAIDVIARRRHSSRQGRQRSIAYAACDDNSTIGCTPCDIWTMNPDGSATEFARLGGGPEMTHADSSSTCAGNRSSPDAGGGSDCGVKGSV